MYVSQSDNGVVLFYLKICGTLKALRQTNINKNVWLLTFCGLDSLYRYSQRSSQRQEDPRIQSKTCNAPYNNQS